MISRVENAPLVGIQLIKLFKLEDWLRTLKKVVSAFLGSPIRVESYLITRARVRTLQSQHCFPSFTCLMPLAWKTPCYKNRGSILPHALIGSKELQEMVGESVTLTAGSAGAHPATSRVAD